MPVEFRTDEVVVTTVPGLADDVEALLAARPADRPRLMLGLVGPPGTGKSTIAKALAAELGADRAVVVQLDGFHLASNVLAGTDRARRRGAVDTFDVGSFASLVERLRANDEEIVYAPTFERDLEEPIGSSQAVPGSVPVVIVEGNYLLVDEGDWRRVRACLDEVWYLHTDDELRLPRLLARHVESGKEPTAAREWVERSDEANARIIASTAPGADRIVDVRLDE